MCFFMPEPAKGADLQGRDGILQTLGSWARVQKETTKILHSPESNGGAQILIPCSHCLQSCEHQALCALGYLCAGCIAIILFPGEHREHSQALSCPSALDALGHLVGTHRMIN